MAEITEERKQLRRGLLGQLGHLVREVSMLEGVIGRVPENLLKGAPMGETWSIKEIFGLMARLDEDVHPERVRRILSQEEGDAPPHLAPADPQALLAGEDWTGQPVAGILERVRAARRNFIGTLEGAGPEAWLRTGLFPKEDAWPGNARQADGSAPKGRNAPESSNAPEEGSAAPEREERDLYWMAHALCQHDTARLEGMTRRLHESHMGAPPEKAAEDVEQ